MIITAIHISFPMALHFLEMATALTLYALSLLGVIVAVILLYVAVTLVPLLVFYAKERVQKAADKAPVVGTVFDLLINYDTLFDYLTDVARVHSTFRLIHSSHSELVTADPAVIEHILKNRFSNYVKEQYDHNILADFLGQGIFAVDGDKWRHQRKLASYEFSTKVLRDFSSVVFRAGGAKLARKVAESARAAAAFDLQSLFMKSTLDSMFKVGFGVDLDTLSGSDEFGDRFSKAFDDSNYIVYRRYADVFWEVKRYFGIGQEGRFKSNIKVIDEFVFQLIQLKRELMKNATEDVKYEKGKEDILSRFIIASEKDPEAMTDRYLRDIILNFLIAGKDTSANTLTWFFYMMCKHPLVQENIVAEIRNITGAEREICDIDDFSMCLTEEILDRMQYLHAALTETLRLYPAVPLDGKGAVEDDIFPNGFKVKKGDTVTYSAYSMGRMTGLWGEDAEEFRPERWLENGHFRPESPFKFVAFHAGPRICLGKEFAYRQMKILAAILLHSFKFKLNDESMKATYRTMFTLHMRQGLPLIAFNRFS